VLSEIKKTFIYLFHIYVIEGSQNFMVTFYMYRCC